MPIRSRLETYPLKSMDASSFDSVSIYLGQSACQLGKGVDQVERSLDVFKGKKKSLKILCDVNSRLSEFSSLLSSSSKFDYGISNSRGNSSSSSSSSSSSTRISNRGLVGVPFVSAPNTWLEGLCDQRTSREVIESLRLSLEICDNPLRVSIISCISGTICPGILEQIASEFPSLSLFSVQTVPPGGLGGANCLNCLLNSNYAMYYPESSMIRRFDEVFHLSKAGGAVEKHVDVSIQQMNHLVATDICFALQNYEWLSSLATSRDIFVDCRTSIWKNTISTRLHSRSGKTNKFNALRACMQNLRSTYLLHEDLIDRYSMHDIYSSKLGQLSVERERSEHMNEIYRLHPLHAGETDVYNSLKWASPNISWHSPLMTPKTSTELWIKDMKEEFASDDKRHAACAIGFQSPFAKSYLKSIVANAEMLLSRGAYVHRYSGAGFSPDDLSAAIEWLKAY